MNTFEIALKTKQLPSTLDNLVPLSFIGSAAVKYYQAKVKMMDQLGISEEQRKVTLADGQDAGELLLNIEARIGELVSAIPEHDKKASAGAGTRSLPDGMHKRQSANAQAIHRNPAAVAAIIKEARDNEDIPTKTAVLNKIKYDKEKVRREKAEGKKQETNLEMNIEEQEYIIILEDIISRLPKQPPKNWGEQFLKLAKGYANIIINRLNFFNE